MAELYTQVLGI